MRHRVINLSWIFFEKFGLIGISVCSFLLYALLLGPSQFGLGVLALTLAETFGVVYCSLLEDPLVRRRDDMSKSAASVFWLGGALSLVTSVVLVGAIWLASDDGLFVALVAFACLKLLASVMARPLVAMLRRERNFKALANRTLAGKVLGALAGIGAALGGAGAWAIVLQAVVMDCFALLWLLRGRWQHVWGPVSWPVFLSIAKEGSSIALKMLSRGMLVRGMTLLLGATTSTTVVGYFSFANRLIDLPRQALSEGLLSYALPAIARRANEGHQVGRFVSDLSVYTALLMVPLFVGALAVGPDIIRYAFDEKWHAAIVLFQILALLAALRSLVLYVPATLAAMGQARIGVGADICLSLLSLGLVWWLSPALGAMAAVLALTVHTTLDLGFKCYQISRVTQLDYQRLAYDYGRILLASTLMLGVVWMLSRQFAMDFAMILIAVLTGLLVYLISFSLLKPNWYKGLMLVMRTRT
ncbi:oligosaccharide flippase family protein [Bowmanella dokdonensis]|uniref:Polysaccharide biosynthesis protein n=1 Tax=Bowmanella dokdonensis TaxID=751969 RepID=A0A939DLJ2_9ALTE|nr:oligosaccharide flippase family protein [Bowmanella dokdonensis]MBN7824693.1 polysaccharide biosynthesis protein [Bowmanella dokdonensis]